VDLRPNKDGAWKLCKIGDLQDCEKTLAVHVHETTLEDFSCWVGRGNARRAKGGRKEETPHNKPKERRTAPSACGCLCWRVCGSCRTTADRSSRP